MRLIKKVVLACSALLTLLFIGNYLIVFHKERHFFVNQMHYTAQDTANSLSLSLAQALAEHNKPMMETLVNAVFKHTYFSMIEVRNLQGKVLISRTMQQQEFKAPDWFTNLIEWPAIVRSSAIMFGSSPQGIVLVTSNTNYAGKALWRTTKALFFYSLISSLVFLTLVVGFMKWLLSALERATKQAESISQHDLFIEAVIPKTPELRRLTLAMNHVVNQINYLSDERLKKIGHFQKNTDKHELN